MAREILSAAAVDPDVEIVGGTVRPGSLGGRDFFAVTGVAAPGARVSERPEDVLPSAEVLIEFTTPEATLAAVRAAAEASRPAVVGTTGLSSEQLGELARLAERIPLLYARNTSVGVNALLRFLPDLVRALDGYDVEIAEHHHRHKRDAPSGTALALGEAIADALGRSLGADAVYGRQGIQPRSPGEIGIHALRAGGNAGEHVVLLADEGEQIQVIHRAYGRRTFALGALRAAKWLPSQPPRLYGMADLLAG